MRTIEVIDETAISWGMGSEFDQRLEAAVSGAAASGAIEVIDETAVSWETGSDFDRSFEAAVTLAFQNDRPVTEPFEALAAVG